MLARGARRYTAAAVETIRRRLHPIAWLALVAMFALALAPAVARALAHAQGRSDLVEVCTPQGMKQVASDAQASGAPAVPTLIGHLDHCPFCGHGSDLAAPPAPAPAPAVLPRGGAGAPPLFLHGPRKLHAWAGAQPRAPPFG